MGRHKLYLKISALLVLRRPHISSSADVAVPDGTEFKSLEEFVSEKTLNAIADMGFTNMMEIQYKSIVPLLKGRYVSAARCSQMNPG